MSRVRLPLALALLMLAHLADARFVLTEPLIPETPPDRIITIQKGAPTEIIGFAADGKSAYIVSHVAQVNVWRVIVYYWPETTAIALGLILLRRLIRAARQRHEVGEVYCRRCDYNLRGLPSPQCPECGTELTPKNRIKGRRRWPRMVISTCFLVSLMTAYFIAARRLPRQGGASEWIDWRSMRLAEWASVGNRNWLTRHTSGDDVLFLVDLEQGKVVRTLCRIPRSPDGRRTRPVLSGDGRTLVCRLDDVITQVDIPLGRIVRQFDRGYNGTVSRYGSARILFVNEGNQLTTWDLQTGRKLDAVMPGASELEHVFPVAGRELAVMFLADQAATVVRVWDPLAGAVVRTFRINSSLCCCDGGKLYAVRDQLPNSMIETWDLLSGKREDSVSLGRYIQRRPLPLTAGNGILVIPSQDWPGEVVAINVGTGACKSWRMTWPMPTISPDGRHIIAGAYCSAGHEDQVRIHDLPADFITRQPADTGNPK